MCVLWSPASLTNQRACKLPSSICSFQLIRCGFLLRSPASVYLPPILVNNQSLLHSRLINSRLLATRHNYSAGNTSYTDSSHFNTRGGGLEVKDNRRRPEGSGGRGLSGNDKIDDLGRLLTRILRHMASELKLDMRSDGYVKIQDLLKLNLRTLSYIPLRSHTVDEVREAVRRDNKQRFSILEENGEILIRANQGHSVQIVETESLLKPILSHEEVPVCVHGTYRKNLESILEGGLKRMERLHVHISRGLPIDGKVISGMRWDVNVIIFLDVRKALKEGMKLYISDNKVILTEGFDGAVPVKYFQKIESWPERESLYLSR